MNETTRLEKIARFIWYGFWITLMTIAAFTVSPYMGVPFVCVLIVYGFRNNNT